MSKNDPAERAVRDIRRNCESPAPGRTFAILELDDVDVRCVPRQRLWDKLR